jgi:hypothetical protein
VRNWNVDNEKNPYSEDTLKIIAKGLREQKPDLVRVQVRMNTGSAEPSGYKIKPV